MTNVDLRVCGGYEKLVDVKREEEEEKFQKTNVVEEDIISHGPQLETDASNLVEVCWFFVFEVIGVAVKSSIIVISSISLT